MPPRSPTHSRGRSMSRSRTPSNRTPSLRSRRSVSPRSASRSPLPRSPSPGPRHNGNRRTRSRSGSRSPAPRSTKIVVERLTKNVTEEHLQEIFGYYGSIKDVQMPMNRQFMTNRGTAYILFDTVADAESAMVHMNEAQLDGAVINVSVVLPRRKFSVSPPPSRRVAAHEERMSLQRGPPPPPPPPLQRPYSPPRGRGPPPSAYGRRPPPYRGRDNMDEYRPRSFSRSRSPRRTRSRSFSSRSRSRSRTPPSRRYRRRSPSPPPRYRGGHTRRSPSYDSYGSRDRSRSLSRDRGLRARR